MDKLSTKTVRRTPLHLDVRLFRGTAGFSAEAVGLFPEAGRVGSNTVYGALSTLLACIEHEVGDQFSVELHVVSEGLQPPEEP